MEPSEPRPISAAARGQGWWSRNWKWLIPFGCGAGCLTSIIVAALFGASIAAIVFGTMKNSEVAQTAFARAKANAAVVEALGNPINEGFFVLGTVNSSNGSGHADIAIPISGPKGAGTIYVTATKSAGRWKYSTMAVEVKNTSTRIDLNTADANRTDD